MKPKWKIRNYENENEKSILENRVERKNRL